MIASIVLMAHMFAIALAIDYSGAQIRGDKLQISLDAAVLRAANVTSASTTSDQRLALAEKAFLGSIGKDLADVTQKSFTFDATAGKVTATGTIKGVSFLTGILPQTLIRKTSTAALASAKVRALDVVLCVDATGSMQRTLDAVKNNILNLKTSVNAALTAKGVPPFDFLRARVIYYRDFAYGGSALLTSNFYDLALSSDAQNFQSFVGSTKASGGGDAPESGLECLWTAMNSPWLKANSTYQDKTITDVFPMIAIYTDAGAHPVNHPASVGTGGYPSAMPRDYTSLRASWDNSSTIDQKNKSIVFFGDPKIEDDWGYKSGWTTVMNWPKFSNPASLATANFDFVGSLVNAVVASAGDLRLTD